MAALQPSNDYEDDDSIPDLEPLKNNIPNVLPRLQSKVLEIFIPLLQSTNENQSIRNAVGEINKLYPLKIKDFPEADEPDDFLWVFYAVLFRIVRRIPCNHPKQERLINFLMTLRKTANEPLTLEGVCVSYFLSLHKIIPTHYILVI
jgi:hypothetical protein